MAESVVVEVLDQNWEMKGFTANATAIRYTEELGQVGDCEVEVDVSDTVVTALPNPDASNPYEGRMRIWEDGVLQYAAVIDSRRTRLSSDGASVTFGGKHRGIELGFYNLGRVDYLGWDLTSLFRELLRNNIAKEASLESVSSQDELYGAFQMVTGDPFKQNYWKSKVGTGEHVATFDLGDEREINAIRVMPQWWKDIDTKKFHYHTFIVETSLNGSSWTEYFSKGTTHPSTIKGHLHSETRTIRYFRIRVTTSTDGFARIAQIMVYQNIASIGGDTTYVVPFIENDDSGNVVVAGSPNPTRPIVAGAFQGDGVITHSYVTRLISTGQKVTQTFRGVSSAVFFTSAKNGSGTADIYVDGAFRQTISIPNNRYWFKGYDTMTDFGGPLSDAVHTLEVRWASGTVQVDYFNGLYRTSWRPVEADDPSIGYVGNWTESESSDYFNFFAAVSAAANNQMMYSFTGDRIRIMGSKASGYGSFDVYIDGSNVATVSTSGSSADRVQLYNWTGSYGSHSLRIVTNSSAKVVIDRLEGNFLHTLYIRSRYEPNLKVLIRMSEIIDSYIKFNHDGTIDLLGAIGEDSATAILEGANEGGTMQSSSVENRYDETGSAVLAIVNVNGELPIKAFVIDKEAVAEIGFKVIKLEQSDAADQFLLNRQALQYLREKRKPDRSYEVVYDPEKVGLIQVGQTTRLYSPNSGLDGDDYRVGRITTEYVK